MPFTAQCPTCSSTLQVPDELAGQVVKCSNCGTMLQMPPADALPKPAAPPQAAAPEPANAPVEEPEADEPRPRKPVAKSGGSKLPLILGGVAAFLLLSCGVCGGLIYAFVLNVKDEVEEVAKQAEKDAEQRDPNAPGPDGAMTVDEFLAGYARNKGKTVTVKGVVARLDNQAVRLEGGKSNRQLRVVFTEDAWSNDKPVQGDTIEVRGTVSPRSVELIDCEVVKH